MSQNSPKPKYISNSPAGKDQLKSGSQQRIAVSLAEDIRQQRTPVKLIGLDGAWGAGKSNVIGIMKEILKDSHHVFIYDAWSHQEDLQRRSFLEELTEDLQSKGLIDSKTWKDKLKVLLAKKIEKTTRTVPQLSPGVVSSLFLIVLSPIFAAIASAVDPVGWKILIALLPLIVTAIVWLFAARRNKAYRNLAYLFHLYKEKELETSTAETISEKEPSVTEFRNWMRELSNALEKEVIVVYDNMDRLPKEKMNNLWSMIHTFFSEHGSHENHRYEKIWVIVPFDRAHIGEAFDKEEMTDQFISKTFPVVYRVPPIVLTDWWEFFGEKYREAFGDAHASEYDLVKNIFDRHQTKITPRAIITFLNELLSLATAWENEMPLRYIALFILNKISLLEDPVANILSGKYLGRVNALFLNDTRVQDYIAALVYNVPVEQASQVALHREILVAIRENEKVKLRQLAEHPSFYSVLEEISLNEELEPPVWTAALDLLENTPPSGTDHQAVLGRLWSQISAKRQTAAINTISVSDTDRIMIKRLPITALQPFIGHLSNQMYGASDFKGSEYYKSLHEIDELLAGRQSPISLPAVLKSKTLLPQDFLDYVDAAGHKFSLYKVDSNEADLDRYLAELPEHSTSVIAAINNLRNDYQFSTLLVSVQNLIVSAEVSIDSLISIFSVYKLLSKDKPLSIKMPLRTLRSLSEEAIEDSPEYYELAAMQMALGEHELGVMMELAFNQHNDELVKDVAERVEWYTTFGDILVMAAQWQYPLVQEVAKRLTLENSDDASMDLLETLPHLQKIAENIDVKPEILFDLFDEFSDGFEQDAKIENLEQIIPDLKTYDLAFGRGKNLSSIIRNAVKKYLEVKDAKSWNDIFGDETSYAFQLLLKALSASILETLPPAALDGYKHALTVYSEGQNAPEFEGPWAFLYEKAPKRSLVATIKDIRDHFISVGEISSTQFLFFERPLRELGKLEEKAGDFVRRVLTKVYEDEGCLPRIVRNSEFYLSLISKAGDDAVDFLESLSKLQFGKESDPELVAFLLSIHAMLQKGEQEHSDEKTNNSI